MRLTLGQTLVSHFVRLISVITLLGCAAQPVKTVGPSKEEMMEARIKSLLDSMEAQNKRLQALSLAFEKVREEVKASKRATSEKPNPEDELPLQKLVPPSESSASSDDNEEELDTSEPVASSRHEGLHWYEQGVKLLEAKKYDSSIAAFERFLKENPGHVYGDRAEYRITQAYFKNHEYQLALIRANQFEVRFPTSFRLGEANYLRARCYEETGQTNLAIESFRDIVKKYPDETVSRLADRRLVRLTVPGSPGDSHIPLLDTD